MIRQKNSFQIKRKSQENIAKGMLDKVSLFILNQGWRLGITILGIIVVRKVINHMSWKGATYLLWSLVPICCFYDIGIEYFSILKLRTNAEANNSPIFFFQEKEIMVFLILWMTGCFGMLFYIGYSYLKIKKYAKHSVHLRDSIFIAKKIDVPFTVGCLKPKIYLPSDMKEDFFEPVIRHEQVHIARKDYLIKNFAFVFLAINWFQPLMWLAYYLFVKDMELTCDEITLRNSPQTFRKQYAKALVELSEKRTSIEPLTTGYGAIALKERIVNIKQNKNSRPFQRILIKVICIVTIIVSLPAYWHIQKPFGCIQSPTLSSIHKEWEVVTTILSQE